MNENDALVLVFSRNAFYKRLHYLVLVVFVLCVIVIGILTYTIIYLRKNPSHPLFFATDEVSRLIQVVPVDAPNMSNDDILKWTTEAVEASYSIDYVNYRAELQGAEKYFTNYGWTNYMIALRRSNNLLAIIQRKFVGVAQVIGKPKIVREGILSGAYAWLIQMPVLVTYSFPPFDDKSKFLNPLQVSVIVQRQPALQGYKGLGIVQSISTLVTTSNQPQEISGTDTAT